MYWRYFSKFVGDVIFSVSFVMFLSFDIRHRVIYIALVYLIKIQPMEYKILGGVLIFTNQRRENNTNKPSSFISLVCLKLNGRH